MSEVLVRCENVSKKFCRDLKKSLWYGIKDSATDLLGLPTGNQEGLRDGEFWANQDISFELKRGECLGIVGRNGAGKTTILKILNGLIKPDSGHVAMRGRVGALIALGAGFNPILTGWENLFVNASILGLTKREALEAADEIVEFAGIAEFMDAAVRTYSSGMQVRLGFAIASTLRPDILIVDEVLAVGDAEFRLKCMKRMRRVINRGCSVILVSHNLTDISNLSSNVLHLDGGKQVAFGSASEVLPSYISTGRTTGNHVSWEDDAPGNNLVKLREFSVVPPLGTSDITIESGCDIVIQLDCSDELNLDFTITVATDESLELFRAAGILSQKLASTDGQILVRATIPGDLLNAGHYWTGLIIGESQSIALVDLPSFLRFEVQNVARGANYNRAPGVIRPKISWDAEIRQRTETL